jgi:hypothetical protein
VTVRGHRIDEAWVADLKAGFGVDESHPRLARMSELVQKSGTVGLTDEELVEFLMESDFLDDEVIPVWNAAHPDRIIHKCGPSPTREDYLKTLKLPPPNPSD